MLRHIALALIACLCLADEAKPPIAKKVPQEFKNFGDTRVDNYYWMRYKENPDVMAYINAENSYTDTVFAPIQPLIDKVYKEFLGRIKQTDMSPPYRSGPYYYYSRTVEGLQYPIFCRKKGSLEAAEEVLLDQNEMAKGHKFFSLGGLAASPDHQLLGYSTDTVGYREFTLRIRDLKTGKDLPDEVTRTSALVWAEDGRTILYAKQQPKTKRNHQVWRHTLGTAAGQDVLVYEEKDERFNTFPSKTRSREYLMITSGSGTTSEVRYAPARSPGAEFKVLMPRQQNITYSMTHQGDRFYIEINDTGRNFRVVSAPVSDPSKPNWKEVIAAREDVFVETVEAFRNHLVFRLRVKGLHTLRVDDVRNGKSHNVAFEEASYVVGGAQNAEYDSPVFRFSYSSMVTPQSVYDYNMDDRSRVLVKRQDVLGGYDPTQYAVERVQVKSHDGVMVPMTIAYKKGFSKNGKNPTLLYGYGAYAIPMDPNFSPTRLSLLDRGFAYAIAHIRGGTDLGYTWYEAGKLLKKKNTFRDFVACAEYLISQNYTNSNKLAIEGGSAGGLLVGAAVTMRPELFQTVVAAVPFVDVVNSLLDDTIPLTTTDTDEFGSPKKQEFYEYLKSYSPYDNTRPAKYPNIYIFSGVNDSQVPYWEPLKWTALLRTVQQGDKKVVLRMNTAAGHGGASGRYDRLKEVAQSYGFVIHTLGAE